MYQLRNRNSPSGLYELQLISSASVDPLTSSQYIHCAQSATDAPSCTSSTTGDQYRVRRHEHAVLESTIEISIVIDEVMSHYHGDTEVLEVYILNIMNTVRLYCNN